MTTLNLLCAGAAQGLVKALQPRFGRGRRHLRRPFRRRRRDEGSAAGRRGLRRDGAQRRDDRGAGHDGALRATAARRSAACAPASRCARRAAARRRHARGAGAPRCWPPTRSTSPTPSAPPPASTSVGVLRQLGIRRALEPRLRTFPNGATAMRELAPATRAAADRLHADHRDPLHRRRRTGGRAAEALRARDGLHRGRDGPRRRPGARRTFHRAADRRRRGGARAKSGFED